MSQFAEELKRWRSRMRLTQEQAAQRLDVAVASIRDWEQGRAQPGTPGPVRKVMKQLLEEAKSETKSHG